MNKVEEKVNDIFKNTKVTSVGQVWSVKGGGWTYVIELKMLPMEDCLSAEGPVFKTAKEAAFALLKVYGQTSDTLLHKVSE